MKIFIEVLLSTLLAFCVALVIIVPALVASDYLFKAMWPGLLLLLLGYAITETYFRHRKEQSARSSETEQGNSTSEAAGSSPAGRTIEPSPESLKEIPEVNFTGGVRGKYHNQ